MGATFQTQAFTSASLATSINATKPSGATTNDLLVAVIGCSAASTFGAPTGWTQVGTPSSQGAVYIRIVGSAPGSDGATYTFTSSAVLSNVYITISRFNNAALTGTILDSYQVTASSANAVMSSLNPSGSDITLFTAILQTNSTGSVTVPSGMTQNFNDTTTVTKAGATLTGQSGGSTGTKTWTNTATSYTACFLAIKTGTTAYSQTPSDTATGTDAAAKAVTTPRADSVSTSDAPVLRPNKVAADSAPASDAVTGKVVGKGAADAPNAYDANAAAVGKPLADGTSSADGSFRAIGPKPADSLTPADENTFTILKGIAETATASEDITLILGLLRSIGEVSEAVDQIAQAFTMGTQTAEVVATEAFSAGVALGIDESVSTADAASRIVAFLRSVNDLVGVADAPAKHLTLSFSDTIGVASDWPASNPTRQIAGVALNHETGEPVEGATLRLFRTSDDAIVQTTTSAADGSYSFARDADDPYTYYVTADLSAGTPVHGVTDRGLIPELI